VTGAAATAIHIVKSQSVIYTFCKTNHKSQSSFSSTGGGFFVSYVYRVQETEYYSRPIIKISYSSIIVLPLSVNKDDYYITSDSFIVV